MSDAEMFPAVMPHDISPKLKLWVLLTGQRDGATPQQLAHEARRWGVAVGDYGAIVKRVEELPAEMEKESAKNRRVARDASGRYKALPAHDEQIIGPHQVPV